MTASMDFGAAGSEEQQPKGLLGNTKLLGGIIAGLGLVGAIYIVIAQVLPAYQENQRLNAEKPQKEQLIAQKRAENEQKIAAANQRKAEAQQQQQEVEALFADEATLNTLLLDVNRIVSARQADIQRFQPGNSQIIADGSLGQQVNGKLKGKEYQFEFKGTFDQTRAILLNMERLQPLLVVRDFRTQVEPNSQEVSYVNGRLVTRGTPRLTTTMTVRALVPVPPVAPPPAAPAAPPAAPAAPPAQ